MPFLGVIRGDSLKVMEGINVLRDGRFMPWRTAGSGTLSPRHLDQIRRDVEILEMYHQGFTHDQIPT